MKIEMFFIILRTSKYGMYVRPNGVILDHIRSLEVIKWTTAYQTYLYRRCF